MLAERSGPVSTLRLQANATSFDPLSGHGPYAQYLTCWPRATLAAPRRRQPAKRARALPLDVAHLGTGAQTTLVSAQTTLVSAQMTLASAQMTLVGAQTTLAGAHPTLADAQTTLVSAQTALASAQTALVAAQMTLAGAQTTFARAHLAFPLWTPTRSGCGKSVSIATPWHDSEDAAAPVRTRHFGLAGLSGRPFWRALDLETYSAVTSLRFLQFCSLARRDSNPLRFAASATSASSSGR